MQFIEKLLSLQEISAATAVIPFKNKDFIKNVALIGPSDKNDLENLMINTEQFSKYTEIKYWLEIISYDLNCIYDCLIYLIAKNDDFLKKNAKFIVEVAEYSFFFDSAISKIYTLFERVAQLFNCVFSLELIPDETGKKGVTLYNVKKKLDGIGIDSICDILVRLMQIKNNDLQEIRHGITHHYHPLNKSTIMNHKVDEDGIKLDNMPTLKLSKNTISLLKNSFFEIDTIISEMFGVIEQSFTVGAMHIENGNVVDTLEMRVKFNIEGLDGYYYFK